MVQWRYDAFCQGYVFSPVILRRHSSRNHFLDFFFGVGAAAIGALHLRFSLSNLLSHVGLGAKHHVLHLLKVLFVLVEFFFQGHRGINLLLQVDLRLIDFLLRLLELLSIVSVDRLEFLFLSK